MRRRAGVLGLVVALVLGVWWWQRSGDRNEVAATEHPTGSASHAQTIRSRAKTGTLGGRVTHLRDGSPIAGATVAVQIVGWSATTPLAIVTTDRDGKWTMPIAPGTYSVAAEASGCLPAARDHVVASDEPIDLALADGGIEVRGTVGDIGGGPVAAARVQVMLEEGTVGVLTRADGTYRMSLPAGGYELVASHDDYQAMDHRIQLDRDPVVQDFALIPGATIRGIVIARDTGKPIADATITLAWNRAEYRDTAVTDEAGKFVLRGAPSGDLALYASAAGYVTHAATQVNLGIGDAVEVKVVADRGYAIRGRVVRSDHPTVGVAHVNVDAHTEGPVPDADTHVETAADGVFEIVGLAPAVYDLTASGPELFEAKRSRVVVAAGDVDGISIAMSSGVTLSGRIQPPVAAELSLSPASYPNEDPRLERAVAKCASDGTFTIRNVPPGAITIEARTPSHVGELEVHVGTVDQHGLVMALDPVVSVEIRGTVVDDTGAPVANVGVTGGGSANAHSATDGTFVLAVHPGYHRLWADRPTRDRTVELDVKANVTGVLLTVPPREAVSGRVVGVDHLPAADVWVTIDRGQRVLTGADGKFEFQGLGKGPHVVAAETARGDASATATRVKGGERVELVLETVGDVHGKVTLDGAPVTSFDVHCEGTVFFERRISSVDGTFVIPHAANQARSAASCSAATPTADGTAAIDQTTIAIELHRYLSVTGTIVDVLSKRPIANLQVKIIRGYGYRIANGQEGVPTGADGRFALDHVPIDSTARVSVEAPITGTTLVSLPIAGGGDLGTISLFAPPEHPGDLGIDLGEPEIIGTRGPASHVDLRRGDRIVSIDGVPLSVASIYAWSEFLAGNANAGQTYAITVARGVTVNITAE